MSFEEAENRSMVSTTLLTVAIIFPILATLALTLRIWTTFSRTKQMFLDDYVLILALIFAWGVPIDVYVAAGLGGVNHSSLSQLDAARVFLLALWIEIMPLIASLVLVKVAILLFYKRIFASPWFQFAVWVYVAILLSWGVACILCQIFVGNPVSAAYDPLSTNPLRFNYNSFSIAFAGMSMCFDVIVLCFPLPVIHRLMMSTRRKLEVAGIFWLGIFCCIASILRFYYVHTEVYQSTASTGSNRYAVVTPGVTWATIEPSTSVIAACLPTYGHLFNKSWSLPSRLRSLWSRLTTRSSNTSQILSEGSNRKPAAIHSSITTSYASKYSNNGRHWQWLGSNENETMDIEMANTSFEDRAPLAKNKQPVQIHITHDFTRLEQPALYREPAANDAITAHGIIS